MGYFDDIVQKENKKIELEELKEKVKAQYKEYLKVYKELTVSTSYYTVLKSAKNKGIKEVIDYFENRNFNVEHEEVSGAEFVNIQLNSFKAQLQIISNDEMHFRIDGKEYEHINIEDKNSYKSKFQGTLYNDEINFINYSSGEMTKETYEQALKDIKEDIKFINSRKAQFYAPDFHYYLSERQQYVESMTEYLDLVNDSLKDK